MTAKPMKGVSSGARLDNLEIESKRELGDWKRVIELLENTRSRNSGSDNLTNFLVNEARLEQWLEEHQPTEKYLTEAKSALLDIKKSLMQSLGNSGHQSGMYVDTRILLAKINFSTGLYEEALDELEKSNFLSVSETLSGSQETVRNYQLMAEAHAMKAQCLEKVGRSWKGSKNMTDSERKEEIIARYLKSADLAVCSFQCHEKIQQNVQSNLAPTIGSSAASATTLSASASNTSNNLASTAIHSPIPVEKKRASSLLDYAIRRGPTLLLEDGRTVQALNFLHSVLKTQETQLFAPIRLMLYRRLAECLLRSTWENEKPFKKLMAKVNATAGKVFCPKNRWEDCFLVLLLSEVMVIRDGVLNQSPEFTKARKLANSNAAAIFDLLVILCAKWGQWSVIAESFEKALKFSFEEGHVWAQYGLTYHASGSFLKRDSEILKEGARLSHSPSHLFLMKAQQELKRGEIDDALATIKDCSSCGDSERLKHRIHLYEGIANFLKSYGDRPYEERKNFLHCASACFKKAIEIDPQDYLMYHWQARAFAHLNNVDSALDSCIQALRLYPFHLSTLELIILLLTAQKNYSDALTVIEESLDEYSEHLGLLHMKAHIEDILFGPEASLGTIKSMLIVWKHHLDEETVVSGRRSDSPDSKFATTGRHLRFPSPTDRETSSMASYRNTVPSLAGSSSHTGNLAANIHRAEAALSEIASSVSIHGSTFKGNVNTLGTVAWSAQLNIWLLLTKAYLKVGNTTQAQFSLDEASQISITHPEVLYHRGQICEYLGEYMDAKVAYESAIAIDPSHVKSLQSLGAVNHYFESHRLAEKLLQDAIKIDPFDHISWYNLGKVLEDLKEYSEAADCLSTSLDVEAISPILPYTTIPICFE